MVITINKIKLFSVCILLLNLITIGTKAEDSNKNSVNIIEITNFFCPYCFQANKMTVQLKKLVRENGGIYDVVPIYWANISPWPAIIYLGLADFSNDQLVDTFFQAIHSNGLQFKSALSTCVITHDSYPEIDVNNCMDRSIVNKAINRLNNAWYLINKLNFHLAEIKLPIFIIEKQGKIIRVFSRNNSNNLERLNNLIYSYIKNIINA